MDKKVKKEIEDFLQKIGLEYSTLGFDEDRSKYYIYSLFRTFAFINESGKGFKLNLISSLKDMRDLCEDYIQKIKDET